MARRSKQASLNEALVEAIFDCDEARVRHALAQGAQIDKPVHPSRLAGSILAGDLTPLMWACTGSPVADVGMEMAALILDLGADN